MGTHGKFGASASVGDLRRVDRSGESILALAAVGITFALMSRDAFGLFAALWAVGMLLAYWLFRTRHPGSRSI